MLGTHTPSWREGYIAGLKKAEEEARAYAEEQFKESTPSSHQKAFGALSLAHSYKIKYELQIEIAKGVKQ